MVPAHEKLSAKTHHPHAVFGISQRTLLLTLEITQHYETQVEFNFRETETKAQLAALTEIPYLEAFCKALSRKC